MKVSKWGGSLAVRLPKALVEQMGLREGDEVNLVAAGGHIAVANEVLSAEARREAALKRMEIRGWVIPPDYKFDREEINSREADRRESDEAAA